MPHNPMTRGMRARAFDQERRDYEKSLSFTECVMGLGDVDTVLTANARLRPALLGAAGKVFRLECRDAAGNHPVQYDADRDERCAACGHTIGGAEQ